MMIVCRAADRNPAAQFRNAKSFEPSAHGVRGGSGPLVKNTRLVYEPHSAALALQIIDPGTIKPPK